MSHWLIVISREYNPTDEELYVPWDLSDENAKSLPQCNWQMAN